MPRVLATACLAALAACTHGAATTTPTAPTGPRPIHRGETLEGVLHLGETHRFLIDLGGGDELTFVVDGEAGAAGCRNWGFEWHQPSGDVVTSNPFAADAPTSHDELPLAARVADAGDMAPLAGTWTFALVADEVNCAERHYRITAR
ncbi:MAG: hypothetical protein K8W52_17525 [Deltaproteobacteria bacterium]|nr:hypothetical protein [Deltaproteobacteria bacterium]